MSRQLKSGIVGVLLSAVLAGTAGASSTVEPGFVLFETVSAQFDFGGPIGLQPFVGVDLGTFDFGGTIGVQPVGPVDTIVQRLDAAESGVDNENIGAQIYPAPGPGEGLIDIELVALSLQSVSLIDIGGGAETILAIVSQDFGSEMVIKGLDTEGSPHGTFDSTLDFEVLFTGATSGITLAVPKVFVASDQDWRHAPTGTPIIDGVNHLLNGFDETGDFWPMGLVIHDDGGDSKHGATVAPLPAGVWMGLALFGGMGAFSAVRRIKRRAA